MLESIGLPGRIASPPLRLWYEWTPTILVPTIESVGTVGVLFGCVGAEHGVERWHGRGCSSVVLFGCVGAGLWRRWRASVVVEWSGT